MDSFKKIIRNASLRYELLSRCKFQNYVHLSSPSAQPRRQEIHTSIPSKFWAKHIPNAETHARKIEALMPAVVDQILDPRELLFQKVPAMEARMREVANYNFPGGKWLKSIIFLEAYQKIMNSTEIPELMYYLCWCMEIHHVHTLIMDDMLDDAPYRRGIPSWWYKNKQHLATMYEGTIVGSFPRIILKNMFSDHKYYVQLMEAFHNVRINTDYGELVDDLFVGFCTTDVQENKYASFTHDFHYVVAVYKTASGGYTLPLMCAMYMTDRFTPEIEKIVTNFSNKMGYLMQFQDDYLDVYVSPEKTGKFCTDISGGKRTWLSIEALNSCNKKQLQIFKDNYGQKDPEKVNNIKNLYDELRIKEKFRHFEKNFLSELDKDIERVADPVIREVFHYTKRIMIGREK